MPQPNAYERALDSFIAHHNARVMAKKGAYRPRKPQLRDRDAFMEDVGHGWITDLPKTKGSGTAADIRWAEALGGPGALIEALSLLPPTFNVEEAGEGIDKRGWGTSMSSLLKELAQKRLSHTEDFGDYPVRGLAGDLGKAGRYMGHGPFGVPVYIDDSGYGSAHVEFDPKKSKGQQPGLKGAFAPKGEYIRSKPSTGTLAHELGHHKAKKLTPVFNSIYGSETDKAVGEALASYLGKRVIQARGLWGPASEDKSWATYAGLPSYLTKLNESEHGVKYFKKMLGEMDKTYPGLKEETLRAIREYDTLVAPKDINDTSRGDWSEEGLEHMKEWRKSKGLKPTPERDLQDRANQAGPYSMRLSRLYDSRAV